ncbi:MAG TPA: glycosyltransferase [Ignavibacteria bacterium]|nr:glycosyltransferase [Ignavibacteria bacterium]
MNYENVGSIVINLLRPDTTIQCISSLLKHANGIKIYCGDQDGDLNLKKFCKSVDVRYIKLRKDCGIGVARNKLVEMALADGCEYFMWGDNDFIYNENLNLYHARAILEDNKGIGVVGGSLIEHNKVVHYEKYMYYDKKRRILTFVPINQCYPKTYIMNADPVTNKTYYLPGEISYKLCDITFNFCLAKKEVWRNNKIRWHNKIKVRFEHSYWFIMFQKYSKLKVAYCSSFQAIHKKFRTPEYDKFRNRDSDSTIYAKALGIDVMFSIGEASFDFTALGQVSRAYKIDKRAEVATSQLHYNNLMVTKDYVDRKISENLLDIEISDYIDTEKLQEFFRELISHNIKVIVVDKTCLSFINHGQFRVTKLHLGTESDILPKQVTLLTTLANKFNIRISTITWESRTKIKKWKELDIHVPLPVVNYLEKLFGSGWADE